MNKAFIDEMREALLSEKKRVEDELSRFAHRLKTKPGEPADFETDYPEAGSSEDDNAAEVANYSDNLSLESTLEKVLRDINVSLKRMDKGEYGVCRYCKGEISEARLRARPTSSSCVSCKKTLTQEV
jgi:DnaK suppressor protein